MFRYGSSAEIMPYARASSVSAPSSARAADSSSMEGAFFDALPDTFTTQSSSTTSRSLTAKARLPASTSSRRVHVQVLQRFVFEGEVAPVAHLDEDCGWLDGGHSVPAVERTTDGFDCFVLVGD